MLVQFSVSHYLLSRALEHSGMAFSDVQLRNASESDVDAVFLRATPPISLATWNPILVNVKDQPGTKLLFDSSRIPGEIVELLFVRPEVPPEVCAAIIGAWYEVMELLHDESQEQHEALLEALARSSGTSLALYRRQLETTELFRSRKEAVRFLDADSFRQTMDRVREFAFRAGMYGKGVASPDAVGMRFPDGKILGDADRVVLEFDTSALRAGAVGR